MKKRIVRITAALCAAALLAGCGSSIGSKDGGYYATEAAAQESYANYDSAAGSLFGDDPNEALNAAFIEPRRRLIKEDERRVMEERARQGDSLALTA